MSEVVVPLQIESKRGDPPKLAFADVFRGHAAFAFRCLKRLGVQEKDVEDVVQEVFLVVHRKLSEFDPSGSMKAWIYGICVRKASDHRRLARHRREQITETVPESEEVPDSQGTRLERKRALAFLDLTLEELDDDKRAVFVLYEIEGLTMADVARAVDCPLQTAYSRLHAARKHVEAACARENARRRS